jgi:hypothetical protein
MRPFGIAALGLAALTCAAGCGSITALNPDGSGGGGGSTGMAGSGGASGGTAGGGSGGTGGGVADGGSDAPAMMVPCPPRVPTNGAVCAREGLACEYGEDPRGDSCRIKAVCTSNHWVVTPPEAASCPPIQNAGMCTQAPGAACTTTGAYCSRGDGSSCQCTNCAPNAPLCNPSTAYTWICPAASTVKGCPTAQPNFGTACDVEGATCNYLCTDPQRICSHGVWEPGQPGGRCPVSTRQAKKEIHYLSGDEIHAMADQALRLKLATYEYKAPPLAGRRHLGFIIEDSPGAPAVDREHDMVDLYGYTSMLLAATQAQQQQIEALQRQVQALGAELRRVTRRKDGRTPGP